MEKECRAADCCGSGTLTSSRPYPRGTTSNQRGHNPFTIYIYIYAYYKNILIYIYTYRIFNYTFNCTYIYNIAPDWWLNATPISSDPVAVNPRYLPLKDTIHPYILHHPSDCWWMPTEINARAEVGCVCVISVVDPDSGTRAASRQRSPMCRRPPMTTRRNPRPSDVRRLRRIRRLNTLYISCPYTYIYIYIIYIMCICVYI